MSGRFHQKLRRARRQLHDHMSVDALYFAHPYVAGETPVLPITVRVHDTPVVLGDLKGTNFNYAEMEDNAPRIVFMRDEIEPVRGMVVSVEPGVAYRIDTVRAPNDITVTARVARLRVAETTSLPVPGDLIPTNARLEVHFPAFSTDGGIGVPISVVGQFTSSEIFVDGEVGV